MELVLRRGRADADATSACFICTFQSPIESTTTTTTTTSLKSPSKLHQFMSAAGAADPHSPSERSAERTILDSRADANERAMSSAKVDS